MLRATLAPTSLVLTSLLAQPALALLPQSAAATLSAIIDPRPASAAAVAGPEDGRTDIARTVKTLLSDVKTGDSVRLLGAAAVPALEALVKSQTLEHLTTLKLNSQPLYQLNQIDSAACLRVIREVLAEDPLHFTQLLRANYVPLTSTDFPLTWRYRVAPELKPAATELLEEALANPAIGESDRIWMAAEAFERSIETSTSRRLIEQNLSRAMKSGLAERGAEAFLLDASGTVSPNLPEEHAYFVLDALGMTEATLPLLASPHAEVRRIAWRNLGRSGMPKADLRGVVLEYIEYAGRNGFRDAFKQDFAAIEVFNLKELERLFEAAVEHGIDLDAVAPNLVSTIKNAYRTAQRNDAGTAGSLMRKIVSGSFPQTEDGLFPLAESTPDWFDSTDVAIAVYRELLTSNATPRQVAVNLFWRACPDKGDARRPSYVAEGITTLDPTEVPEGMILSPLQLDGLEPEWHTQTLSWLGSAGSTFEWTASIDLALWSEGAPAFRAAAFNPEKPWRERAMALLALFSMPGVRESDVEPAAAVLREGLQIPAQRELFVRLILLRNGQIEVPLSRHWNAVIGAIYETEAFTNATKEQLYLSPTPTGASIVQRLINGASASTDATSSTIRFQALYPLAAPLAAAGRVQIPDPLLSNWLSYSDELHDLVTYVNFHQDDNLRSGSFQVLLKRLQLRDDHYEVQRRIADECLRSPDSEMAKRLIYVVTTRNSSTLTKHVTGRISELRELRRAGEAWAEIEQVPTREAALTEVLKILKTGSPDARLEAIRGLGTLNAIEALPTLIGVVESGTDAEKQLAKEVLQRLNEPSARER